MQYIGHIIDYSTASRDSWQLQNRKKDRQLLVSMFPCRRWMLACPTVLPGVSGDRFNQSNWKSKISPTSMFQLECNSLRTISTLSVTCDRPMFTCQIAISRPLYLPKVFNIAKLMKGNRIPEPLTWAFNSLGGGRRVCNK